jgi:ribosomal protein S18 acetylase RimI-like enzyme
VNHAIKVISFDKSYNLKNFDSGEPTLNRYLTDYASQDLKRYLASVFLGIDNSTRKVIGYYTLSSSRIDISELDNEYTKKLPNYPYLPSILIGRLAIDKDYQRQKLGEYLLLDALNKSFKSEIAAFAVIVEAKNTRAANFYKSFGFREFLDNPDKLFLPMNIISKLFV